MAMTFKELIRNTPEKYLNRGNALKRVLLFEQKVKRIGNKEGRVMVFHVSEGTGGKKREVNVWFEFPDMDAELKRVHLGTIPIRVRCSGEWFNFSLAYVLQKKKVLLTTKKFSRATKDAPKVKNPNEIPYACKHLVAVYNFLSNRLE